MSSGILTAGKDFIQRFIGSLTFHNASEKIRVSDRMHEMEDGGGVGRFIRYSKTEDYRYRIVVSMTKNNRLF